MLQKKLALALLALFVSVTAFPDMLSAQNKSVNLQVKSAVYGSTQGPLPFWMHSNRDGKVDSSGVNWINEIGYSTDLFDYGRLSVDAGGNLVGRFSNNSSAHFNELYLHADFGGFRLSGGRFINPIGLNNHDLSVGSMMVSRNATPVPRISLYTPEFLDVPFLNGHLQYKGLFNHGWLEKDRFVSNALLHQKYFYLRINAGNWSGTGGLIHNVVWGGSHPRFGPLPNELKDFFRVVVGKSAERSALTPGNEQENVLGNSIAAYEFGLKYHHEKFTASITRLFYLEDRVSTRFRSPWDGVWGLNFSRKDKNSFLTDFIYEHINTKQQDAKSFQGRGRAIYYNNAVYQSGWTYNEQVLGIPLILYNPDQLYDEQVINIKNNIIIGHHIGMEGKLAERLEYKFLATYSRNYGFNPYSDRDIRLDLDARRTDQYSFYTDLQYRFPGSENLGISLDIALDTGELYEQNVGFGVGLVWNPTSN